MQIYVGNLNFETTEDSLRKLFAEVGEVQTAKIVKDPDTGRSRGFAFIEMPNNENASAAIRKLNGHELDDRSLKVNQAKPRGF